MKKRALSFLVALLALPLTVGGALFMNNSVNEVEAGSSNYSASSLASNINLNDSSSATIRSYYSSLNGRSLNGDNLLKALKPILSNNQKYYKYDGSDAIWKMYEISDRDWTLSPANEISGYDEASNTISGYRYKTDSTSSSCYVHALYVNRKVANPMHAWGNHQQNYGGINREHIWPKSRGFDGEEVAGARGDPMHLWAADGYTNNIHSNYAYGYVDTSKSYTNCQTKISYSVGNYLGTSRTLGSGTVFEPQDSDKGDIARACFYMAARYNNKANNDSNIDSGNPNLVLSNVTWATGDTGTSSSSTPFSMGILSDLLAWNELDPPDEYEIHRNNILFNNYTNNRNPFIDFPSWANIIWGGQAGVASPSTDAINTFSGGGVVVETAPTSITLNTDSVNLYEGETEMVSVASVAPEGASESVTWTSSDEDVATVSETGLIAAVSKGSATITATSTLAGGVTATISVTVNSKSSETTDVLIPGNTRSAGSYDNWVSNQFATGAIYAGRTMSSSHNDVSTIQMNTTSPMGIVTTNSGGRVRSISVVWNDYTTSGNTLTIYGKNTPYSISPNPGAYELYDQNTRGTLLGTIVKDTNSSLEINDDYLYIGLRSTKNALYFNSITITYAKPVTGVSLNETSLDMVVDDVTTLVPEVLPANAEDKAITWTSSVPAVASVNSDGEVTALESGSTTIRAASHDDPSIYAECVVTVSEASGEEETEIVTEETDYFKFKKVTSVTDLHAGDKILIGTPSGSLAMSTSQNRNNRGEIATSCEDNLITLDEETTAQILTLGKEEDCWTFSTESGYLYAASSDSNHLRTQEVLDDNGTWAITIEAGNAVLEAQGSNTHNKLRYNSGSHVFSCYASGQQNIAIFKSYEYEADVYGNSFLNTYTSGCHSNGVGSTINWSGASSAYSALTTGAQTVLTEVTANEEGSYSARAAARYDYIVGKYGVGTYADFMGRNPDPISNSLMIKKEEVQSEGTLLVLVVLISFAGLASLVFFMRRKER